MPQAGRAATAGHSPPESTGDVPLPLRTDSGDGTAGGPGPEVEVATRKTQPTSGPWAHRKPLRPLLEASRCFTCLLLPLKPEVMGTESSVQGSRKQPSGSGQLSPWHVLAGRERSLNANAEGTCPRLQYKLKKQGPLPASVPTHPSPIPLVQTP